MKKLLQGILLLTLFTACQKQDMASKEQNKEAINASSSAKATSYAQSKMTAEIFNSYNWEQPVPLKRHDTVIAVKVMRIGNTAEKLGYLLVHNTKDGWGDIVQHEITYAIKDGKAQPKSITSTSLMTKRTGTKKIVPTNVEVQTGRSGTEKKSLVSPGGTLPMVTIVGTYSNSAGNSTTSNFGGTVSCSPTDFYLANGGLGYSSGGGGINNYGDLDYLDPLYTPDGGNTNLEGYYSLNDTRFINGIVYRASAFPGIIKGFPWVWWEGDSQINEQNVDIAFQNLVFLDCLLEQAKWLVKNPEENVQIWYHAVEKEYDLSSKYSCLNAVALGEVNRLTGPYDFVHDVTITAVFQRVYPTFPSITPLLYLKEVSTRAAFIYEENKSRGWSYFRCLLEAQWEVVHVILDIAGTVPVLGEVFDVANGVIYTVQGDGVNATLSYSSAVPFLGWGATTAKYARKTMHLLGGGKVILHWQKVGSVITFGNRADLRKVLELNPGMPVQAHHIIPWGKQNDALVQAAAGSKNPFHMNEFKNGFPLHESRHMGSHPNYDNRIQAALDEITRRIGTNPDPNIAASELRSLTERITNAIRTQADKKIDDVIF